MRGPKKEKDLKTIKICEFSEFYEISSRPNQLKLVHVHVKFKVKRDQLLDTNVKMALKDQSKVMRRIGYL